ncbi:MAG TPA: SDR family NAD(P)-dependent oxidoreductase [Alphaproteobacteria bacterium]|jgi:NAD(P)-dependent dehydrogenase (short-subunit alcohol dehydrogenase family)
MSQSIRFDGRAALVTGAGKGLGRAYALLLAQRGAAVVVNNRKREPASQKGSADLVVDEIKAAGGKAVANYDSVERRDSGERMVKAALEAFGHLDILVNNAGIDQHAALHNISLEEFERVFAINFFGSLYVTKAALPLMREKGYGRIVFTTSSAGLYGLHGLTAYSASKGAIIAFMRALAQEVGRRGIRANAVAPYALTPMTERQGVDAAQLHGPELVAPLVAWLASEQCSANGETFIAGSGHFGRAWAVENAGVKLPADKPITPEDVAARIDAIRAETAPRGYADAVASFLGIKDGA